MVQVFSINNIRKYDLSIWPLTVNSENGIARTSTCFFKKSGGIPFYEYVRFPGCCFSGYKYYVEYFSNVRSIIYV